MKVLALLLLLVASPALATTFPSTYLPSKEMAHFKTMEQVNDYVNSLHLTSDKAAVMKFNIVYEHKQHICQHEVIDYNYGEYVFVCDKVTYTANTNHPWSTYDD